MTKPKIRKPHAAESASTLATHQPALNGIGFAGTLRYLVARGSESRWVRLVATTLSTSVRKIAQAATAVALTFADIHWTFQRVIRLQRRSAPQAISASQGKPDVAVDGARIAVSEINSPEAQKPRVTATPTGARVVDKRRVSIPTIDSSTETTRPEIIEIRNPHFRIRQATTHLTNPLFSILGTLIFTAYRIPLRHGIPKKDLGRQVWTLRSCRVVLLDKYDDERWLEVLNLASDETAGDWRPAVLSWLNHKVPPALLVQRLDTELKPGSLSAIPERRLAILLRIAQYVAQAMPDKQTRELFGLALTLARMPLNPYEYSGLILVARKTVTIMLEQRPELDELVFNSLELQRPHNGPTPGKALPLEARLFAIALRNRSNISTPLTTAAVRGGLSPDQLEAAALLADSTLLRRARVRSIERPPSTVTFAGLVTRHLLPWFTPPALALGTGAAANIKGWDKPAVSVGIGEAIALLALIVTVHVFTVTLSAARLPGVITRSAGQPAMLFFSYSSVLTVLGLTVFRASAPWLVVATTWATLLAFIAQITSLLAAMFMMLRRTDAARAASGYVAATLSQARAAGRRFGRIQAAAVELRETLETIPSVRMSSDVVPGEWSDEVTAQKRGFFLPSRRGLHRLLNEKPFIEGMQLRLIAGLGTIVDRNSIVATLVPGKDQDVRRSLVHKTSRRLKTRSSRDVEEVATGAVALTQLTFNLVHAGELGTAHAVAQHVVYLISQHIAAARQERHRMFRSQALRARAGKTTKLREQSEYANAEERARDTNLAPVVPALRDVLRVAIRERLGSREDNFDIPESLIEPLLSSSLHAEASVAILTYGVPTDPTETQAGPRTMTELLRIAGVRALELRDSIAFAQVLDQLSKISKHPSGQSDAIGIASVLAAVACRFDPAYARSATDALLSDIADIASANSTDPHRIRMRPLWRIGAAALACGVLSIAVHVARKIHESGHLDEFIEVTSNEDTVAIEAGHSKIRGAYLGDTPKHALENFARFVGALKPIMGTEMASN